MKKLNAFQLKILALVVMLLDHLYFSFPEIFPAWFHPLSRFVAPLFAFLMVEGFFYTRNRLKYNIRLFGWAIFMQFGNIIINTICISRNVSVHNNIFMTLALGLAILNTFEYIKKIDGIKKCILILMVVIMILSGVLVEGGISLIPFIIITYLFKNNMKQMIVGYSVLSGLLFFMNFQMYESVKMTINMMMFNSDFLLITVIPFILVYNGKRGTNTKWSKYLFYIFYPLHLWILAFLEFVLVGV